MVKGEGSTASRTERFSCPVCGITLFQSDFNDSDVDYHCPYCTTGKRPSRLDQREPAVANVGAGS